MKTIKKYTESQKETLKVASELDHLRCGATKEAKNVEMTEDNIDKSRRMEGIMCDPRLWFYKLINCRV